MITKEQLKAFVENNPKLVSRKESTDYPGLYVLKYSRRVFYDSLWTPELELCRGLVLDKDWNVVVRPFTKIYNRFEQGTDFDRDEVVTAVEKKNGFMAAVTFVEGHCCIVSTTGSLDSDYVKLAKKYVEKFFPCISEFASNGSLRWTWLFEICSPEDPHIIPEQEGAWLIGAQACTYEDFKLSESALDDQSFGMGAPRPGWERMRFSDLCAKLKDCRHEGYVVHSDSGKSLKMKSPYYLTKKALARGNFEKICLGAKDRIDEEYYPLLDYLKALGENFTLKTEQEKLEIIRDFLENDFGPIAYCEKCRKLTHWSTKTKTCKVCGCGHNQ